MSKHDKLESYGVMPDKLAARGDRGWDNPRDSDRTPTHDDTRLTAQERYGVTYGDGSK